MLMLERYVRHSSDMLPSKGWRPGMRRPYQGQTVVVMSLWALLLDNFVFPRSTQFEKKPPPGLRMYPRPWPEILWTSKLREFSKPACAGTASLDLRKDNSQAVAASSPRTRKGAGTVVETSLCAASAARANIGELDDLPMVRSNRAGLTR
eukprot:CAMPEP_0203843244 /NCGR_PEP_ID=MMETSP0359-20131031/2490_1 /ASSEMBLY_ACC=CAM_ASM_000338 /TAXON_ID=268821 /ORGANISM="Scrippsiella Hangoei, Strain SHTV-5" /LENGTH=149 /DNA_ID=CAMNT_0050757999 /DNA_START=1 /DNA_END=450 /DNA_ORIENTATION=+